MLKLSLLSAFLQKYSDEWNAPLLKAKIKEVFNLNIEVEKWFEEEGVDEEEVKKRPMTK